MCGSACLYKIYIFAGWENNNISRKKSKFILLFFLRLSQTLFIATQSHHYAMGVTPLRTVMPDALMVVLFFFCFRTARLTATSDEQQEPDPSVAFKS